MIVPLFDLDFDQSEEDAVIAVLRSKWISMGSKTKEFEELFSSAHGVKHGIAVSNCTVALHLAFYILLSLHVNRLGMLYHVLFQMRVCHVTFHM